LSPDRRIDQQSETANEPTVNRENVTNEPTDAREKVTNEASVGCKIVTTEPTLTFATTFCQIPLAQPFKSLAMIQ
jgi:hypothetical protein